MKSWTWDDETLLQDVLETVREERRRQFDRYGTNADTEDGTGPETCWLGPLNWMPAKQIEQVLRADYLDFEEEQPVTWVHLVREEVAEAFAESDPERLEAELIQVAALCVSWVEKIRARS
jgi:hypothetical protein